MADDQNQLSPEVPDQTQAQPDQIDQKSSVDQGTAPPNQVTPEQAAAQHPYPGDQQQPSGQAGTPGAIPAPQLPKVSSNGLPANDPNNPQTHPAVQKAAIFHSIAQTLAGGPRFTTSIDPNTGKTTYTQQPLSNKDIGLAIAMAAITGGIAGLGEKGPGAEGRAAQQGFAATSAQRQQVDQQQEQQASQDYARQAAVTATNFQTHQNALRLSQMELDYHKQFVDTAKPILSNVNAVGASLAQGVAESDLLDKYHVTKDMAIPDGLVQRGKNPDGSDHYENTYTVIDPQKKIALPEETAKLLADMRIPGYFSMKDGKAVPTDFGASTPQVKAGLVVNGLALAQGYQITEAQLNRQFGALKNGNKEAADFDANLKQGIASGDVTAKDLRTIANYANIPIDQAVAAMQKDKVDASTIQAYRKLVPEEAIQEASKQRLDREAADKSARDAQAAVDKQKAELPGQIAEAAAKARIETAAAGPRAFAGEQGRIKAKEAYDNSSAAVKDMVKNPKLSAIPQLDQAPVNGVNVNYMKALNDADPNMAAVVKAIGEGRQLQSKYGLVKEDGQRLASIVQRAYPEYSTLKADAYEKMLNSYTSGEDKKQIESGNTTYRHIQDYVENSNKFGSNLPGAPTRVDLEKDASQLVEEVNSAYTKGVLHEEQRKNLINGLSSVNPVYRQHASQELTKLLSAKTSEKLGTFRRGALTSATPDFEVVSPEAKQAYQFIMQDKADPNFGTSQTQRAGVSNTGQAAHQPAAMLPGQRPDEIPVKDANGAVIGFTKPGSKGYRPVAAQQ